MSDTVIVQLKLAAVEILAVFIVGACKVVFPSLRVLICVTWEIAAGRIRFLYCPRELMLLLMLM